MSLSLGTMDLDELPGGLVDVDDMYLGNYLNGIKADAAVKTDFLPSLDLPDDLWGDGGVLPTVLPPGGQPSGQSHSLIARTSDDSSLGLSGALFNGGQEAAPTKQGSSEAGPASEEDAAAGPAKGGRRRTRKITPQRQQNNRKAQQRYREKRKVQAASLDAKVAALTSELEHLKGLQGHAKQLEQENEQLRLQLKKRQAGSRAPSGDSAAGDSDIAAAATEVQPEDDDSGSIGGDVEERYDALKDEARAAAAQMSATMRRASLSTSIASAHTELPKFVAADLQAQLSHAQKISVQMLLLAPVCPLDKILSWQAAQGAEHPCEFFRARWNRTLTAMSLTDKQQETLLAARQDMLSQLRRIYEQRQNLNQVAMSIMLPRQAPVSLCGNSDAGADQTSTDGKIRWAEKHGVCSSMSQSAHLSAALNDLRANLAEERKLLAQLHALLVQKVLSPTQSAVMFILADATPVEPLHVTNLIAAQRGVEDMPATASYHDIPEDKRELLMKPYSSSQPAKAAASVAGPPAGSFGQQLTRWVNS